MCVFQLLMELPTSLNLLKQCLENHAIIYYKFINSYKTLKGHDDIPTGACIKYFPVFYTPTNVVIVEDLLRGSISDNL